MNERVRVFMFKFYVNFECKPFEVNFCLCKFEFYSFSQGVI